MPREDDLITTPQGLEQAKNYWRPIFRDLLAETMLDGTPADIPKMRDSIKDLIERDANRHEVVTDGVKSLFKQALAMLGGGVLLLIAQKLGISPK